MNPTTRKYVGQIIGTIRKRHAYFAFRINNPGTRIIGSSRGVCVGQTYSQAGQDWLVWSTFFRSVTNGFFVDVGANDPEVHNNTMLFETKGWTGIALDPLPEVQSKWLESRPGTRFLPLAASNKAGSAVFEVIHPREGWEHMLSGLAADRKKLGPECESHETTVRTVVLREVFRTEKVDVIDYLSIDVEGHELKVLEGIDFDDVRINVITVENNTGKWRRFGESRVRELMSDSGFVLYARIEEFDDVYVNKSFRPRPS